MKIIKKILLIEYLFDVLLIFLFSLIYYLNQIITTNEVLYIPKGSIYKIITHLEQKHYKVSKLDAYLLRLFGSPQSGWIYIGEKKLTRGDFLYKLTKAKAATTNVMLIPGETSYIFLNILAKKLDLDRNKLQFYFEKYAPYPDGVFIPNTYKLPLGITEEYVLKLLLNKAQKEYEKFSNKIFGTYNKKKWLEYLIIASIVQKEAASIKEMPIVASVIYNRLKKGMKLQMDGALNYGKYSHIKITAKRLRTDTSRYNTYLYAGLPPYPVCNVSFDAIKAAIFPAKTSYLYFVKQKNNKHYFSSSYTAHVRMVKKVSKSNK